MVHRLVERHARMADPLIQHVTAASNTYQGVQEAEDKAYYRVRKESVSGGRTGWGAVLDGLAKLECSGRRGL